MSVIDYFIIFFFFFLLFLFLTCVFRQNCTLPCNVDPSSDTILLVHSYYEGRDQLGHQNQNFQNRTSLFLDQISRGNAYQLLKEVNIQDEGRCKCYTSTAINIYLTSISTPVSDIRIHQDGNRITCSSEGIYPQPELTWSTEPPSNINLDESIRVQQTEDQLYNISSSLKISDEYPDLIYSCTIRTRSSNRTETYKITGEKTRTNLNISLILNEMSHLFIFCLLYYFRRLKSKKSKYGTKSASEEK
uniref:Ig-like domain-containing protein n=1 Tax=Poecilia reticulata TaxID=8081 RepID=A0A3P9QJD8_POERE